MSITVILPEIEEPVVVTLKDINTDNKSGVMVAFRIPSDVADKIALIEGSIPGAEAIPPKDLHITLAYLGDASDFLHKRKLMAAVEAFAKNSIPLEGQVNGTGQFADATDGKKPYYANFDSPALPEFRQELVEAIESSGVFISKSHGFTPHITLAYIPEGYSQKLPDIPGVGITFDEILLSVGEDDMVFDLGRPKPVVVTLKGGPGSGHRGHVGRPGKRGGSTPGGGNVVGSTRYGPYDVYKVSGDAVLPAHVIANDYALIGYDLSERALYVSTPEDVELRYHELLALEVGKADASGWVRTELIENKMTVGTTFSGISASRAALLDPMAADRIAYRNVATLARAMRRAGYPDDIVIEWNTRAGSDLSISISEWKELDYVVEIEAPVVVTLKENVESVTVTLK